MRKKILIVDDDNELRRTLALALSPAYDVAQAPNGRAALALLETGVPDLVLLDLSMPDLSGLDVLRRFHPLHPETAVIMLTAEQELGAARRALAFGARSYITKPCDEEQVKAEIDLALAAKEAGATDPAGKPWRIENHR